MIQATYQISKDDIVYTRLQTHEISRHIIRNIGHYMLRFLTMALIAYIIGSFSGKPLSGYILVLTAVMCSVFFAFVSRKEWVSEVFATANPYKLKVELDDEGVIAEYIVDGDRTKHPWSEYEWMEDDGDRIKIRHRSGFVSCIPKSVETQEVIEFTRTKVKNRKQSN